MATREQLIEANKKAVKSPNHGKHGKRKLTLLREKAEQQFVEELKEEYKDILRIHREEAKKPKNYQERRDLLKRLLGS